MNEVPYSKTSTGSKIGLIDFGALVPGLCKSPLRTFLARHRASAQDTETWTGYFSGFSLMDATAVLAPTREKSSLSPLLSGAQRDLLALRGARAGDPLHSKRDRCHVG